MSTLVATGGDNPYNEGEDRNSYRFTVIHRETGVKHTLVVESKNPDDAFDEVMNKLIGSDLVEWIDGDGEVNEVENEKGFVERMNFWDEFKITSIRKENNYDRKRD